MDTESEQWPEWESRFTALADAVQATENRALLAEAESLLCFYGENGLTPEEEFAELTRLVSEQASLRKILVETSYWQDIVLFIPSQVIDKA